MDFSTKLVLALIAVDSVIIAVYYLWLRSTPPIDDKTLFANGVGLFMFVIQAVMFSQGVILTVQLATIAIIFTLCYVHYLSGSPKASDLASK